VIRIRLTPSQSEKSRSRIFALSGAVHMRFGRLDDCASDRMDRRSARARIDGCGNRAARCIRGRRYNLLMTHWAIDDLDILRLELTSNLTAGVRGGMHIHIQSARKQIVYVVRRQRATGNRVSARRVGRVGRKPRQDH